MSETLAKVFDVEYHPIEPVKTEVPAVKETENQEDTDFDTARDVQHELLEMGRAAIGTAMRIASESENPRAIEVLSGLLKNVSDMNKQLVTLHKDKADVKLAKVGKVQGSGPQIQTQQNLFVGNSADLNKMLADKLAQVK